MEAGTCRRGSQRPWRSFVTLQPRLGKFSPCGSTPCYRLWRWATVAAASLLAALTLIDVGARHPYRPRGPCHLLDRQGSDKDWPSAVASFGSGRLGNQLSTLASILGFQRLHGVRPHLTQEQVSLLHRYFDIYSLDLTFGMVLESVCPDYESLPWTNPFTVLDNVTQLYELSDPQVWQSVRFNRYLDVGKYVNDISSYKAILPGLRQRFQFQKRFSDYAQDTLQCAEAFFRGLSGQQQPHQNQGHHVTFVSVHCRRSDYKDHLQVLYGVEEVGEAYIRRAMDLFRTAFNNDVIFVMVSDDMAWVREKFQGQEGDDAYIPPGGGPGSSCKPGSQERAASSSPADEAGMDLALLSSVNHSILTYGTFGMWGALLAGGRAVLPKDYMMTKESKEIEAAGLEGWSFI